MAFNIDSEVATYFISALVGAKASRSDAHFCLCTFFQGTDAMMGEIFSGY